MAQRRSSSTARKSGAAASKASGEAAASPEPSSARKRKPVEVRAGGFVTHVDPDTIPETPEPIIPCSVCGSTLVDDHCPNGHGSNKSGGWQATEREHEG